MDRKTVFFSSLSDIACHFVSQILMTYLSDDDSPSIKPSLTDPWDFTYLNWLNRLKSLQQDEPNLPWSVALFKAGLSLEYLAHEIFQHFQFLQRHHGHYIGRHSPMYPDRLKSIRRPPLGLSAIGNLDWLQNHCVAVIGARQATAKALKKAEEIGFCLANGGYAVASGGALGCDAAAHWGTVQGSSGCPAIIVFASGLARLHPQQNSRLFREVVYRGGLLLSERLFQQPSRNFHFPIRNRIIAGLSQTTVIMQAALHSGTHKTANIAFDQGRHLYVFDEGEDDIRFQGNQDLLHRGAQGFIRVEELMQRLPVLLPKSPPSIPGQKF